VIAHNYERYVGNEQQEGGLQQHEVASAMDLIEGNTYMKVFMDVFHGNSGVSTYFRNYLTTRGFDLWSYHRCHNIIGNAITASQVRKRLSPIRRRAIDITDMASGLDILNRVLHRHH